MLKTNSERKDRIRWLRARIDRLLENDIVRAYTKWKALSDEAKAQLAKRWQAYYQECSKSKAAQLYWGMRDEWKANDFSKVNKMTVQAIEIRKEADWLPKPSSLDPQVFMSEHRCSDYDKAVEELEQLQRVTRLEPEDIFQ